MISCLHPSNTNSILSPHFIPINILIWHFLFAYFKSFMEPGCFHLRAWSSNSDWQPKVTLGKKHLSISYSTCWSQNLPFSVFLQKNQIKQTNKPQKTEKQQPEKKKEKEDMFKYLLSWLLVWDWNWACFWYSLQGDLRSNYLNIYWPLLFR